MMKGYYKANSPEAKKQMAQLAVAGEIDEWLDARIALYTELLRNLKQRKVELYKKMNGNGENDSLTPVHLFSFAVNDINNATANNHFADAMRISARLALAFKKD